MGKYFTWAEIQHKSVPRLESFSLVADRVVADLNSCPYVLGGQLYGSIVRQKHSVRSDVDCLAICAEGEKEATIDFLGSLFDYAKSLYVPLNLEVCERCEDRSSFGTFGPGFIRHISRFGSSPIKVSPLELIGKGRVMPSKEAFAYFNHKIGEIDTGQRKLGQMGEHERCIFLQKAMQSPIHAARKILLWQGVPITTDNKDEIIAKYDNLMSGEDARTLRDLVSADNDYTKIVVEQLQAPDQSSYLAEINKITKLIPLAREFVWTNSTLIK